MRRFITYVLAVISAFVLLALEQDVKSDHPATGPDVFEERLLATLSHGVDVKRPAVLSLFFSTDGRQVAYRARYRVGGHMRESVVLGDKRGPEFAYVEQPALSPDGSKIAYLAAPEEEAAATYLIIGNRRDQIVIFRRISGSYTDPQWKPVFSPDGKRLAYKVDTRSGDQAKQAIRVADISDIPADSFIANEYTQLASVSGPDFDDVDGVVFSADSSRMAYAANDHGKWFIVVDGKKGPEFDDALNPVFSPDGKRLAYMASRKKSKEYFMVVDNEEGPVFDMVGPASFSPDGSRLAYGAREGGKHFIVVGTERRPANNPVDFVVFSSDGKQIAFCARRDKSGKPIEIWSKENENRGKQFLFINDRPSPEFNRVGYPVFDDSATIATYWAREDRWDNYVMMVGDRKSERFDGIGQTRVFSPDGSRVAFGVLKGRELRWKVMNTR